MKLLGGGRANFLLNGFETRWHAHAHIERASIDAARLPGPRQALIVAGRAGETRHALQRHNPLLPEPLPVSPRNAYRQSNRL